SSRTLEAKGGRDAICDIQLNSVAALQSQGLSLRERFRNLKSDSWRRTRIQLVGAEFDPIVNPDLIVQIGQIIGEKLADRSHTCLYRPYKGVKIPHVIFDLTEQPFAPMPWRKSFLDQAIQFLDGGAAFSQNEGEQFVSCAVPYE
ncbi:MAG: hypothetical protein NTX25_22590, partial [Proteobacteria bacterium]|nr:hypothetical protein [Pseudomonadota bacterium]